MKSRAGVAWPHNLAQCEEMETSKCANLVHRDAYVQHKHASPVIPCGYLCGLTAPTRPLYWVHRLRQSV